MEKNYYKLSGTNDYDLGISFKAPKIKFKAPKFKPPKINFKAPKFKAPKINTKSFSRSVSKLGKGISGSLTKVGDAFNQINNGVGSALTQVGNVASELATVPFEIGGDILNTGMDMLGNVTGSVMDMVTGGNQYPEQTEPTDEELMQDSEQIATQEQEIYTDPTYGDYVLDADGNPLFFSEESNQAYYG